jgi:uncharacterized protein YoxC
VDLFFTFLSSFLIIKKKSIKNGLNRILKACSRINRKLKDLCKNNTLLLKKKKKKLKGGDVRSSKL